MAPTGVSTGGKPKVDVVSLDSGEASLAAGPPRPEANCWKFCCFVWKERCWTFEDLGKSERGHGFYHGLCVLNQYGLWFKMSANILEPPILELSKYDQMLCSLW